MANTVMEMKHIVAQYTEGGAIKEIYVESTVGGDVTPQTFIVHFGPVSAPSAVLNLIPAILAAFTAVTPEVP